MNPHPEYVKDLREHVQHTFNHCLGIDPDLWGSPSLPYTVLPPSTIWSPEEKNRFFRALSRYSRFRPDLIAGELGGGKSVVEVCVYLDALERESAGAMVASEDSSFGLEGAERAAVEVPAKITTFEEKQARILRMLERDDALFSDSDEDEEEDASAESKGEKDEQFPQKRRRIEGEQVDEGSLGTRTQSKKQEQKGTKRASFDESSDARDDILDRHGVARLAKFYFHNVRSQKGTRQRLGFAEDSIVEEIFSELEGALKTWLENFIRALALRLDIEQRLLEEDEMKVINAKDVKRELIARRQPLSRKHVFSDSSRSLGLYSRMNEDGGNAEEVVDDGSSSARSSDDERAGPSSLRYGFAWHPEALKSLEESERDGQETLDAEEDHTSSSDVEEELEDIEEQLVLQNAAFNERQVADLQQRYSGASYPSLPEPKVSGPTARPDRFTAEQTAILEEAFGVTAYPNPVDPIAKICGLSINQVKDWFKYRRRKSEVRRRPPEPPKYSRSRRAEAFNQNDYRDKSIRAGRSRITQTSKATGVS